MSKPKRRIGFDVMIRISDWMVGNKDKFARDNITAYQAAEMATKEFGVDISPVSIRHISGVRGIKFASKRRESGLTSGMRKFSQKDVVILNTISHLYKGMGEPEPAPFRELYAEMLEYRNNVEAAV